MKSVISIIVPCFLVVVAMADDELTGSPMYCQDLNPQSHLDIEQVGAELEYFFKSSPRALCFFGYQIAN